MTPNTLFYIILGLLILDFVADKILDYLNAKHYGDAIPEPLKDVYDHDEYLRSQEYKKTNYKFSLLTSTLSFIGTLLFLILGGFGWMDDIARSFSDHPILIALLFFGLIMFLSDLLGTPFSWYHTFVIEEKFGFNKTTRSTFITDKLKGWAMSLILGGGILALVIWFYQIAGKNFWIYAWIAISVFTVFLNMFYAKLIVPLFNKQTPLADGALKEKIHRYAEKTGFLLDKIVVIDGSKRSTKANAYFSGFGSQKRVTLYDTLLNDLEEDEIVAVLAHEVGHYKKKHIIFNMIASVILTGFTLFILSLFINIPELSLALGVKVPSFHAGLIAFGILYSPISEITGLLMNYVSRKFEYQADAYARETFAGNPLITSLKKLSKNSLGNLTPHPAYVFVHYSHPTILQRIKQLQA